MKALRFLLLFLVAAAALPCMAQSATKATVANTPGLPPGIVLQPNGEFKGTPLVPGDFVIPIKVCDSEPVPQCATGSVELLVYGVVQITPTTLAPATVGVPYDAPLVATGGAGTYTWTVTTPASLTSLTLCPPTGCPATQPSN